MMTIKVGRMQGHLHLHTCLKVLIPLVAMVDDEDEVISDLMEDLCHLRRSCLGFPKPTWNMTVVFCQME